MKYALLDWDNTLRKNYTLFQWIEYLSEYNAINQSCWDEIKYYIKEYRDGKIAHDKLAEIACSLFTKDFEGVKIDKLERITKNYMEEDEKSLFSFTKEIFNVLNQLDIKPIIVSGAPKIILEYYRNKFGIYEIFAFDMEIEQGKYSGNVASNYGYNKDEQVEKLCNELGENPIIAFGDSSSDLAMLEKAQKSVLVCDSDKLPFFNADIIINTDESSQNIKILIEKAIQNI